MVRTRNNNASDTDNPNSGLHVAGLPAMDEGIIDDNMANQPDNDMDKRITINVPLGTNVTYCEPCRIENRLRGFLNLKELICHCKEQHNNINIVLKCKACSKTFPVLKNWNGHKPKCKGPQNVLEKPFKYTECQLSFDTQTGRSQHERHMHPNLRNFKRKEEAERPHGAPGRREYVWTQEETNKLIELNTRFKNARFPNKEIQQYLPGKTLKQISDKRRDLDKETLGNIVAQQDTVVEVEMDTDEEEHIESTMIEPNLEPEDIEVQQEKIVKINTDEKEFTESIIITQPNLEPDEAWKSTMTEFIDSIKISSENELADLEAPLKAI